MPGLSPDLLSLEWGQKASKAEIGKLVLIEEYIYRYSCCQSALTAGGEGTLWALVTIDLLLTITSIKIVFG